MIVYTYMRLLLLRIKMSIKMPPFPVVFRCPKLAYVCCSWLMRLALPCGLRSAHHLTCILKHLNGKKFLGAKILKQNVLKRKIFTDLSSPILFIFIVFFESLFISEMICPHKELSL